MTRMRYALVAVASLIVAVAGYAYWTRGDHAGEGAYVTEALQAGVVASTVTATGTVNPVTTVQVGTYVSGPIQALYVDYNSPVKQGQLVAKIDSRPFQVKVQEADANLANARAKVEKDRADLEFKKLTLDRNRELLVKNLIAQNDLDTAKSNYDQAVAQLNLDIASVQQAEASLQEARINLAYTDITSPVDGVVVSRNVDVGQTVAASFQTPTLFLIAQDLTKMQVDTNVSESDIGGVRQGQSASFTVDAYPGKEFPGSVAQVRNAPITLQNVVTYDVVIAVDNADLELKPGMTATVTITTARRDDVLRIPLRALRFHPERKPEEAETPSTQRESTRQGAPTVWVLQPDGTLRKVVVKTGVRSDQYAELASGELHEGDQLAVAFASGAKRSSAQVPAFAGRRF
ncbi:MAG TPA: efflux RND transporter periplasmic adaptor subunit [Candidatus Acidoferrales bacterium]|nr:efflux RND transporter periplasmic adaptor subunit [Candidatus Acidoferrales bacterium]